MSESERPEKFNLQAEMLANRVRKRYRHFAKRFARQGIEVFRLYDWDIPEIRAVVDWYAGHLVVGEYTRRQSVSEWLPMMGAAAAKALDVPPERLHLKERRAGFQDGKRYERLDFTEQKIAVSERDFSFLVNPDDFVDTGLFADHRITRQMVRERAAGRDFLNLYCYTGTFTGYAIRGGARASVSVDRSETAIAWAGENLALNGLTAPEHELVQAPAFSYLNQARREGRGFDLAVVDPPSFSQTEATGEDFDILRDHPLLLEAVAKVMRPGGTIFFSTNHQDFFFRPPPSLEAAAFEEITQMTVPEDFVRNRPPIHRCWRIPI
jgi:23S rRNA (cytosine1962-C5)-methyltransferase